MTTWIADCSDSNISIITEFLEYYAVPYQQRDLWQCTERAQQRYDIPEDLLNLRDSVLLLHPMSFEDIVKFPPARYDLAQFLQHNHVIVWGNCDSFDIIHRCHLALLALDSCLDVRRCWVFVDAVPSDHHWPHHLKNINIVTWPLTRWIRMPRIRGTLVDKNPLSHDFLLTMFLKSDRPHRTILWQSLSARPDLLSRGLVHCARHKDPIMGQESALHHRGDRFRFPSMELYRNAWLEIVPETFYRHGYYISEKTSKPMATRTPFLMVANQHYLKFLHNLGFKTFHGLIDESYDDCWCIKDRVSKMLDQLQDIVNNGSEQFYTAAKPILDHNYHRLCEIEGDWENQKDRMLWRVLSTVDQKIALPYNI